jgi:HEPN domain-containing protein
MADRSNDWLAQGKRDLAHAIHALEAGDYEWSCFSAQQAAEKAVKAIFIKRHAEAWGHSVTQLPGNLPQGVDVPPGPCHQRQETGQALYPEQISERIRERNPG